MLKSDTLSNCHFCSVISNSNGEDPIGSMGNYDSWLIIEAKPPWPCEIWQQPNPMPLEVVKLVNELHQQGHKFRQLAIAPDAEYSHPDYTRVIYYRRPTRLFTQYEKYEYLVPYGKVGELAIACFQSLDALAPFASYRQNTSHIRELLVCTHGNVDIACSRFGYPIYRQLRDRYAQSETLRVWRVSHFGGHQFAPTLIDLPTGHSWGHLTTEILSLLIHRHDSVEQLLPFYRGWSGLTQFEQIAEREIWKQEGWKWLDYAKAGRVLAQDDRNEPWNADWAEVQIDFTSPNKDHSGSYQARIEAVGEVTTAWRSGDQDAIGKVKQYQVIPISQMSATHSM